MFKWAGAAVAVVATALTPIAMGGSADAVSATCKVGKQSIDDWSADKHRVWAKCSAIGRTTLVQGQLPITGEADSVTPWFRTLNTTYYGEYKEAWYWQLGTPRINLKG